MPLADSHLENCAPFWSPIGKKTSSNGTGAERTCWDVGGKEEPDLQEVAERAWLAWPGRTKAGVDTIAL